MKSEILAPAGSKESLIAAVNCGADAVYLGVGDFNARKNAENFTLDTLSETVKFCRARNVRVYVTLNTLVSDSELKDLYETIERITLSGADALILQDLGAAKAVRRISPDIKMHASTQMSVQTLYGVEQLAEMGFSRVVLAREINKGELEYIVKNSPIETELFVHGALCMCVSGQCQLSAALGGRSGNRGLCAQPCRLPFKVHGGTGNDLSLKDLSLIERLPELQSIGVTSFKIEGRMKRPEYVAGTVTACREALDNTLRKERLDDLQKLFSRSGFTSGYYDNMLGRTMFGVRNRDDVVSAADVLGEYKNLYQKQFKSRKVKFEFTAKLNEKPVLFALSSGKSAAVKGEIECEKALKVPLTEEKVIEQLNKCGNTPFCVENIKTEIDENVSLPLSVINSLRRDALEKLLLQLSENEKKRINKPDFSLEPHKAVKRKIYLRFDSVSQIPEQVEADRIIIPLFSDEKDIERLGAVLEIPRGIFNNSDEILKKLKTSSAKWVYCSTLDAINIAKRAGKRIIASPYLNIFNSLALSEAESLGAEEITVSNEMTLKQLENLSGKTARGVAVYGRQELMLTRNCPVKNAITCVECERNSFLTDRKGIEFPVRCVNNCSVLFNSVPTYMADRLSEIRNADFMLLSFTTETKEQVAEILLEYKNGSKREQGFTRGLLYRGVE